MAGLSTSFDLSKLTDIKGSPKYNRTYVGWTCVRKCVVGWEHVFTPGVLPAQGERLAAPDGQIIALKTIDINKKHNTHAIVTINYVRPESLTASGFSDRKDGKPEYSIDDGTMEKPIEDHENYLANWNYALLTKNGTTSSPAWWQTAKDLEMSEADSKKWKWQKEDIPVETGWFKSTKAQKPRIENYLTSAPIIQETTYFKKLRQLIAKADFRTAIIKTPATDFAAKLCGEYLINSLHVIFDGEWWAINKSYQYADTWDRDIYNEG